MGMIGRGLKVDVVAVHAIIGKQKGKDPWTKARKRKECKERNKYS
jgi:hypothetical protein